MSTSQKSEYVSRVRKIINSEQLQEISRVIDLLSIDEADNNYQEPTYILIDRLDDRWIDDSLKYKMINSLVEAVQKFRKIRRLKIIVALRTDVIERAIQENQDSSFQREKFRDYLIEIKWKKDDLYELINKRIELSFRRKYSPSKNVGFHDIFVTKVKSNDPFEYLVERTLLRPRDIISFINECFDVSDEKNLISPKQIYKAEDNYSRLRYEALLDEWRTSFPSLKQILEFLRGKRASFTIGDIGADEVNSVCLSIIEKEKVDYDPLFQYASDVYEHDNEERRIAFLKKAFEVLYRVGAVGLKKNSTDRYRYVQFDRPIVSDGMVSMDANVRVAKMLYMEMNIHAAKSDVMGDKVMAAT